MGTDIHLAVEKKTPEGDWVYVPDAFPTWPYPEDENGKIIWPEIEPERRNYDVFAFLAGVRNGFGFAGVYRHEPVEPLFTLREPPEDLNKSQYRYYPWGEPPNETEEERDQYKWLGEHSFTWATIAELREAPWEALFVSGGVVDVGVYEKWVAAGAEGPPETWSGGVSGQGIETWTRERYEQYVDRHNGGPNPLPEHLLPGDKLFISIQWEWQPLLESKFHKWLFGERIDQLVEEAGGPDNVRVLMGFDS